MPFDPSLPANAAPLESQVIRDQLQALFNLINNIVTLTAAQVDGVNTLPPGSSANVNVTVMGGTLRFTFDLPQGAEGPQGVPGEVSAADLSNAFNATSNNSNGVPLLGLTVSDPPTQSEMQQIANRLDELVNALRR